MSKKTLTYFFKIALGAEYRDKVRVVKRWMQPVVSVKIHGALNIATRGCLNRVIRDFNALTKVTDLRLTDGTGDIQLFLAPVMRFRSLDPDYVRGNDGFVSVRWSGDYSMYKARVLIGTTGVSDAIRCHLIREELTQSMGLMRDSNDHPGSVFYGRYLPAPTKYSALDERLIALLYSGALSPGDTKKDITNAVTVKH